MSDVYKKLSALDASKGPAPDGIPPCLIKQCSFILARPLFFIFNESLALWKSSFITPILKSGDRTLVTSYSSISILSCIPKVFESLVCDFLTPILKNNLINQQYEFIPQRSTDLNLLLFTDFLSESLEMRWSCACTLYRFFKGIRPS